MIRHLAGLPATNRIGIDGMDPQAYFRKCCTLLRTDACRVYPVSFLTTGLKATHHNMLCNHRNFSRSK